MEVQDTATKQVVIPGKAIQNLILQKASGIATIYDPSDESVYWNLHLGDGKIYYATSGMGKRERLAYFSVQDKNLKRLEEEGLMEITTNQSIPHESD